MYRMIPGKDQPLDYAAPVQVESANDEADKGSRFDFSGLSVAMWVLIGLSAAVGGSALCWIWRALTAAVGGL